MGWILLFHGLVKFIKKEMPFVRVEGNCPRCGFPLEGQAVSESCLKISCSNPFCGFNRTVELCEDKSKEKNDE